MDVREEEATQHRKDRGGKEKREEEDEGKGERRESRDATRLKLSPLNSHGGSHASPAAQSRDSRSLVSCLRTSTANTAFSCPLSLPVSTSPTGFHSSLNSTNRPEHRIGHGVPIPKQRAYSAGEADARGLRETSSMTGWVHMRYI